MITKEEADRMAARCAAAGVCEAEMVQLAAALQPGAVFVPKVAPPAVAAAPPKEEPTPPVVEHAASSDELRDRLLAAIHGASTQMDPETIREVEAAVREGAAGPDTAAEVRSLLKLRLMREGR